MHSIVGTEMKDPFPCELEATNEDITHVCTNEDITHVYTSEDITHVYILLFLCKI